MATDYPHSIPHFGGSARARAFVHRSPGACERADLHIGLVPIQLDRSDRVGLIHPAVDVHTLGINSFVAVLNTCGISTVVAEADLCLAALAPEDAGNGARLADWIRRERITFLGFSYRLDPGDAVDLFVRLRRAIFQHRLHAEERGPIRGFLFAGLAGACARVRSLFPEMRAVFRGGETFAETISILGLRFDELPAEVRADTAYDQARLDFGRRLVRQGAYHDLRPIPPARYPGFGTENDTLVARLAHRADPAVPLLRAHVGPFLPDREEAVRLFKSWTTTLAHDGFLDILSIGTSQLSQERFFGDWAGRPDAGGVPLHSPQEFAEIWQAARPMLVRCYAGTDDVPAMARMLEQSIHSAWHALSLWWFCQIDGRGPNDVVTNLRDQLRTLAYVATVRKPYEANVAHHFAFRGADDITCIASACIAARVAKQLGVRTFILPLMLNTPRATWGIQDLAKARAALQLTRQLEDAQFRVIVQPRAGLDLFSPDAEVAKTQLAAVTALMADIEPEGAACPPVIHVVSYSEGFGLADPAIVNESIKITRQALHEYRVLRARGEFADVDHAPELRERTCALVCEVRALLNAIEQMIPDPYSPTGLYAMLAEGFFAVPDLWQCREEFARAVQWKTRLIRGAVRLVDADDQPITTEERIEAVRSGTTIAAP